MKSINHAGSLRQPWQSIHDAASSSMWSVVVILALIFGAATAQAQVLYGSMNGNVTDSSGAAVPGAAVSVVDANTGLQRKVLADSQGQYTLTDLPPGTYTLTVEAQGFGRFEQKNLIVNTNTVVRSNPTLQVGDVQQSVTVSDAPPLLQTDSAQTASTISAEQIATLPTSSSAGRNFQSLLKLIPGSTPPAESNSAAGNPQRSQVYNVNGITNTTNTTRIDGAIDAFPTLSSLTAYLPPTEAIDSINIVTGSFNAEQGSAGGAAVNVTIKSGTNHFHGGAWEYNSINLFNAQAWQNRTGIRQKNIYNEFGVRLGGPIVKDKLFFFADWNRVKTIKAVNGTTSVPTADMRAGNFQATGTTIYDPTTGSATNGAAKTPFANDSINPANFASASVKLLALLPLPNLPGYVNNYFGSAISVFTRDNIDTKITYNPSNKSTIFGHYSISPDTISDPQIFGAAGGVTWDGGQPGTATGKIQNLGLGATYAYTPNFLIDANAGYTRQFVEGKASDVSLGDYGVNTLGIPGTNYNGNPDYAGIPAFFFNTYGSLGNATTSNPFKWRDNQYTGNVNATWLHKSHSFRFGGEYLHAALNHFQPGSLGATTPRGAFTFSGGVTSSASAGAAAPNNFNSFADFLLGLPSQLGKTIQIADPLTLRYSTFAFYAQDTWQATPSLTVNYGVRYEYYPLPVADHYGMFFYDPSVLTQVSDAYGTHQVGTVIVGGEGGVPNHAGVSNGSGTVVPRIGISYRVDPKTVIRSGFGITVDPDNLRSLLSAYPGTIGSVLTGSNSYVAAGSLATGIPAINIPSYSSGSIPLPATISTYTIPKNYRRGYIESFNVAAERELFAKLVATATYAGSHAIRQQTLVDINAGAVGGANAGRLLNTTYGANNNNTDIYSIQPFRGSVYNGLQTQLTRLSSVASFGVIYTFSKAMDISDNGQLGSLIYAYPTYWNNNWALAGYDRKHNFQFWSTLQSPIKGNGMLRWVASGWQLTNILSRVSGTPFNVTSSGASLSAPGSTQVADRIPGVPGVLRQNNNGVRQYLNPAAFAAVTTARFGSAGRSPVRGPGLFNLDTSLKRSFPIWREIQLSLQAESFDVTNTPAFANPAATASTPAGFGVITSSNANRTLRLSGHIDF